MSKRDMSGAIFRNKRKEKDTHPDRTGQCVVAGVEYWISGWMEEHNGEPYMSIKFKPKEGAPPERLDGKRAGRPEDMENDIPF